MTGWLEPGLDDQRRILALAAEQVVQLAQRSDQLDLAPRLSAAQLRDELDSLDVESPRDGAAAVGLVTRLLMEGTVHTTSPSYFGLFNPTPSFMGVVGDLLTAAFNPQLAAWSHSPAANEIEGWSIRYLARRLGLPEPIGGSFTSGGAEANAQAVHLAVTRAFPTVGDRGLRAAGADPLIYVSGEGHHAWLKIAHVCGLGRDAVRLVPATPDLRLDVEALEQMLTADRRRGGRPTLIVATAGTTSAGAIDPLDDAARVARQHECWYHVDAAWAGAVCMSDRLGAHLAGIEHADSVTVDAHKWLSVPMGAGVFLTGHLDVLGETYRVATSYMPDQVGDTTDPYTTSNQWSRRFIGLKLFLTLLTAGRSGYAAQIERDAALGEALRARLGRDSWTIVNTTPLPVVCIADRDRPDDADFHGRIVDDIVASGRAWISTTVLRGRPAIRINVISHRTTERHIDQFVGWLAQARRRASSSAATPDPARRP
jgi:glutamate/tyrosine decarboxylase-like PLP-dependent enzyme